FFIGNRIRTCISDDVAEAKAVLRQAMSHYTELPYYRNYWKEAGYIEEMTAIEQALAAGRGDEAPRYLTDQWRADVTLFGPPAKVGEGVEAWREAGIRLRGIRGLGLVLQSADRTQSGVPAKAGTHFVNWLSA